MRKEQIAKVQIIAGVVLILITICFSYYLAKSSAEYLGRAGEDYMPMVSEAVDTNQINRGTVSLFTVDYFVMLGTNMRVGFCLGMLLDLVLIAQAVMFILTGMKTLAKE